MIRKFISTIAVGLALSSIFAQTSVNALDKDPKEKSIQTEKKDKCDCQVKQDLVFIFKNKNLLSEDEVKSLEELDKCHKDKKDLSKDQTKVLLGLKDKICKCKLGDEDFKKFKCLLEKDSKDGLSEEEEKQLQEFAKKLSQK